MCVTCKIKVQTQSKQCNKLTIPGLVMIMPLTPSTTFCHSCFSYLRYWARFCVSNKGLALVNKYFNTSFMQRSSFPLSKISKEKVNLLQQICMTCLMNKNNITFVNTNTNQFAV